MDGKHVWKASIESPGHEHLQSCCSCPHPSLNGRCPPKTSNRCIFPLFFSTSQGSNQNALREVVAALEHLPLLALLGRLGDLNCRGPEFLGPAPIVPGPPSKKRIQTLKLVPLTLT